MATTKTTDITVRFNNGTYETNTVQGQRASCSHSANEAASRLGRKLYGEGFQRAEQLAGGSQISATVWRLHGRPGERFVSL